MSTVKNPTFTFDLTQIQVVSFQCNIFFYLKPQGVYGHKFFQILDYHIPDIVFLTGYLYRNIIKAKKRLKKQVFIALRCITTIQRYIHEAFNEKNLIFQLLS
jgi:hypothetical protein